MTETATLAAPTAPHVLIAMSAVMEKIGQTGISKDRRNKEQGYNFRGIDDVYNDLNPIMAHNRLLMIPVRVVAEYVNKIAKSGATLNYARLTVDWLMASAIDGSTQPMQTVGEAMDSADKASNKAQSAAMKYAALMVFMIPTEGDNDADATTHDVAPSGAPPANRRAVAAAAAAKAASPPAETKTKPERSALMTAALNAMRDCQTTAALRAWSDQNGDAIKALSDDEYSIVHAAFLKRGGQLREAEAQAKSRPALNEAA